MSAQIVTTILASVVVIPATMGVLLVQCKVALIQIMHHLLFGAQGGAILIACSRFELATSLAVAALMQSVEVRLL